MMGVAVARIELGVLRQVGLHDAQPHIRHVADGLGGEAPERRTPATATPARQRSAGAVQRSSRVRPVSRTAGAAPMQRLKKVRP